MLIQLDLKLKVVKEVSEWAWKHGWDFESRLVFMLEDWLKKYNEEKDGRDAKG